MRLFRAPVAALLTCTLLGGCSLLKTSDKSQLAWEARQARLSQIDRFTLAARVSSGGLFGVKGNLNWSQKGESFEMRVAGPFGIGAATLSGTAKNVEIKTAKGVFKTSDPEGDIKRKLGWAFPVAHLRYWALGVAAPGSAAEVEADAAGRPETLEQDGWSLEYEEWQMAGSLELPRKFTVANDEVTIKVVIDSWADLPTLAARTRGSAG